MKLKQQVTNLEISKKLKELGVKQDSMWWWIKRRNQKWQIELTYIPGFTNFMPKVVTPIEEYISTFTVAELGEMLPAILEYKQHHFGILCRRESIMDMWIICYRNYKGTPMPKLPIDFHALTEADARGKMLIYLIEEGLI